MRVGKLVQHRLERDSKRNTHLGSSKLTNSYSTHFITKKILNICNIYKRWLQTCYKLYVWKDKTNIYLCVKIVLSNVHKNRIIAMGVSLNENPHIRSIVTIHHSTSR